MNILLAILAALYIPQTNDKTLEQTPLNDGEAAFTVRDELATLKIGKYDLVDRASIHGYEVKTFDRTDYVVTVDGGFTYDGVNDKWTLASTGGSELTNHVTVTAHGDIYKVSAKIWWTGGVGENAPESKNLYVSGNTAVYTLVWSAKSVRMTIENLSVSTVAFGNPDAITDLTTVKFHVKDDLGESYLGDWRSWAKNLYNGNRGENWANYKATNGVDMAGHMIAFDSKVHYYVGENAATNLMIYADGFKAIEVDRSIDDTTGYIGITAFAVTNHTCYVSYTNTIENFDAKNLKVFETYSLTKPIIWRALDDNEIEENIAGRVVVKSVADDMRFLKLVYHDIESNPIRISMYGAVNVVGSLSLNGTNIIAMVDGIADYAVETSVTNAVATAMTDMLGENWKTTYGGGLAGILAAIFAAIAWLKSNKLTKGLNTGGTPTDENVGQLFTSANTSLVRAVNYTIGSSGNPEDHTVRTLGTLETATTLTIAKPRADGSLRDFAITFTEPSTAVGVSFNTKDAADNALTFYGEFLTPEGGNTYIYYLTEIGTNNFLVKGEAISTVTPPTI